MPCFSRLSSNSCCLVCSPEDCSVGQVSVVLEHECLGRGSFFSVEKGLTEDFGIKGGQWVVREWEEAEGAVRRNVRGVDL